MTESIFVPFRLTKQESVEKLVDVLEGSVTPLANSNSTAKLLTKEEAIKFFADRKKKIAAKR